MANNTPIETDTLVARIDMAAAGANLEQQIKDTCDEKGAIGYVLRTSFSHGQDLILIFQLTR